MHLPHKGRECMLLSTNCLKAWRCYSQSCEQLCLPLHNGLCSISLEFGSLMPCWIGRHICTSSAAAALSYSGKLLHSVDPGMQYPSEASNGSFFYYSSEQGPAHGIWLSPYVSKCACLLRMNNLLG